MSTALTPLPRKKPIFSGAHKKSIPFILIFLISSMSLHASGDGSSIDKVYHPYVHMLEKEVEFRTQYQHDSDKSIDGNTRYRLGYGQAIFDRVFAEFYLTGAKEPENGFRLESYELEVKWQLSEQGEFNNDWGLLFELEKEKNDDVWEANTTLIVLHEWFDWIATANLSLIYEWGNDINNEWETAFAGQLRYRYNRRLEPGIELYQAQDSQGVGPTANGLLPLGGGKQLNWELGAIVGTNNETADLNWKLNIEYEFK